MPDTQVLIVGAGPVGLTLAIDLGQRGIRCTLIERKDKPAFLPKMERVNARTMEIYRRMGLSKKIRAAGLRRDVPMDVYHRAGPDAPAAAAPALSVGGGGRGRHPRDQRRQRCRSSPISSSRNTRSSRCCRRRPRSCRRSPCAGRPNTCRMSRTRRASRTTVRCADGKTRDHPRRLSRRLRWRHQRRAPGARHQAARRGQPAGGCARRSTAATSCSTRFRSATAPATAATITWPTSRATLPHHAGLDQALDAARHRRHRRGDEAAVREGRRHPGANTRCCRAIPGGRTCCWPTVTRTAGCFWPATPCIWSFPTGGLGMNSGVGDAIDLGWKLAATLAGWGGPRLLAILRDRAPPDRRPQRRRLALRQSRPPQVALDVAARHPRQHAGGQAHPRYARRRRRCRAAQVATR